MQVFVPQPASTRWDHWGDYASMLTHGMTAHLGRREGLLQLERTGPVVPPVTFPGFDIVVTDATRQRLEARLPGLVFRPVIVARCVALDWTDWDPREEEPPIYPRSGEPADYVLAQAHDASMAERIGLLWELVPELVADVQGRNGSFRPAAYAGQPLVRTALSAGRIFASGDVREALIEVAPEWVSFQAARIEDA